VADASHELRTPVAAMRAMLDVTAAGSSDPGLLGALDAEVARLEQLVGDLLALARSDQTPRPRVSEVDVDQALRAEAEAMRQRSSLRVDTSGVEAGRVLADPDAVARLIRNLGDNALRHARTQVWLTATVSDGVVTIGVDDDGTGIASEDRERVFDRLVRLDPARDRTTGGSGLGLSVVRALARDAGGDACFVEPRHGGASAEVHLPVAPH
jgi:signal transduction histidine kinase